MRARARSASQAFCLTILVLWTGSASLTRANDSHTPQFLNRYYDNSLALLIGIDRYRDRRIPPLRYAVNDVLEMEGVLKSLGFRVVSLINEHATKANIEAEFRKLGQATPRDRLVIFFAGHGQSVSLPKGTTEGFLMPHDAEAAQLIQTGIPMRDIDRLGERLPPKHILFILDACHSGFGFIGFRDVEPQLRGDPYYAAATDKPVVQVFTAGETGQKAIEQGGQGLFTRWLIHGLRGAADRDGDGVITANELAAFVEPSVARESGGIQKPVFGRLFGEGQFLFQRPLQGRATSSAEELEGSQGAAARRRLEEVRLSEQRQQIQRERERLETERRRLEESRLAEERQRIQEEQERLDAERRRLEEARRSRETGSLSVPTPKVAVLPPPPPTTFWAVPSDARNLKNQAASVGDGKYLFETNCVVCHGASGAGDGVAAPALSPRPLDLRLPRVQGQTDGELFWKISNGRGAMPPWKHLPEMERWRVVNYIRSLR